MWQRLKQWCFNSLTIAWGYLQVFMAAALLGLQQAYDLVGMLITDPNVKSSLDQLHLPAIIGLVVAVFGAITIAARMRTVTSATNTNNQVVSP